MPSNDSDNREENSFFDTLTQRTVKLTAMPDGILKIEILGFESTDVSVANVYSLDGIMVLSQPIKDAVAEIDISRCQSGTYVLMVLVNDQQTTWKIAK